MIRLSWAYIAGFVDGEGTICVPANAALRPSTIYVLLPQSEPQHAIIAAISEFLSERGITNLVTSRVMESDNHNTLWLCKVYTADSCQLLLRRVLPYLIVKRSAAEEALGILASAQRGMTGNAWRSDTCSRGHNITEVGSVYVDPKYGKRSCRRCRAENNKIAEGRRTERSRAAKLAA